MRIRESFVDAGSMAMAGAGADATDDIGAVAVFFDFENIILGVEEKFRVSNIINALNERGEVMIRRAYADWGRYRRHQRQFLMEGVQMVFLPSYGTKDKNRTDTAICVDAMEILFTRPLIDTYVIASGDSDFGVLAHRLRDHGKRVIGLSAKNAASEVLVKVCHEFIFYETLVGERVQGYSIEEGEQRIRRALGVVIAQHGPKFRASVLKDRMRKQDPGFSEKNYGAGTFTRFLRNFEQIVSILEGGMVAVTDDALLDDARPARDGRDGGALPKLAPEIEAEARDVLSRALRAASEGDEPVRLSRLKDAMQQVAPDFDELGLGFRTFTRFLKAFPDIVEVERDRNRVRPVGGTAADEPRPKKSRGSRGGDDKGGRRRDDNGGRGRDGKGGRGRDDKGGRGPADKSGRGRAQQGDRGRDEQGGDRDRDREQPREDAPAAREAEDKGNAPSREDRRRMRAAHRPKAPEAAVRDTGAEESPTAKAAEAPAPKKSTRSRATRSATGGAASKDASGAKAKSSSKRSRKKAAADKATDGAEAKAAAKPAKAAKATKAAKAKAKAPAKAKKTSSRKRSTKAAAAEGKPAAGDAGSADKPAPKSRRSRKKASGAPEAEDAS